MKYWYIVFEVIDNRSDESKHVGVGYADAGNEFSIKKLSDILINFFDEAHPSNELFNEQNQYTSFKSLISLKEISVHQYMQLGDLTIECWLKEKQAYKKIIATS